MLIGLVSYPILTRLFDVADYGMLGLVSATIPLFVGLGKMGLQHASMRFYSEVNTSESPWTHQQLYSTLYLSMLVAAVCVCALMHFVLPEVSAWFPDVSSMMDLLMIASYLVIARVLESAALNLFQAKEQASRHAMYITAKRTLVLIATLGALLLIRVDLTLYFMTLLLIEGILISLLLLWSVPKKDIRVRYCNGALFGAMLVYGVPMLGTEVSTSLIGVTDRYVIGVMLGIEGVGQYTSAFTLVEYAQAVITAALATSALPIFLRIDAENGRVAASEFISSALRFYAIAAMPLIALMAVAGESMLTFLAGSKYAAGASIMPWASAGLGVHGAFVLLASGLYLGKRTRLMFALLFATALANVILSLLLVPKLGIEGAAISTLICYVLCALAAYYFSRRVMTIRLPIAASLHALLSAAVMCWAVSMYTPSSPFLDLLFKGFVGMSIYIAAILLLNREMRASALQRALKIPFITARQQ